MKFSAQKHEAQNSCVQTPNQRGRLSASRPSGNAERLGGGSAHDNDDTNVTRKALRPDNLLVRFLPKVGGMMSLQSVERREVFVADVAPVAVHLGGTAGRGSRVHLVVLLFKFYFRAFHVRERHSHL